MTETAALAALLMCLGLANAQGLDNPIDGRGLGTGSANQSKWHFDLDRSTSKDLSIRFGEFSPVLDAGISHGGRNYRENDSATGMDGWNETATRLSIRVPLGMSTNTYSASVESRAIVPITYSLSYGRFQRTSMLDWYPRWGHDVRVSYSHAPIKSDYDGAMLSLQAAFFLPGLLEYQSLRIEGGYERQKSGKYRLESQLCPRGYDYSYHKNIYKASINYSVPITHSSLGLGPLPNLNRVSANLFYDHAIGQGGGHRVTYNSIGAEISADVGSSRLPVTIELGMRAAYRLADNEYRIEPVCFGVEF